MVRAMYAAYEGSLYTVRRKSDNTTKVIGVKQGTGYADSDATRAFCPPSTVCEVVRIWDQSPRNNHLEKVTVPTPNLHGWPNQGINPLREELTVGGHPVFSAYFEGGQDNRPNTTGVGTIGFRCNNKNGTALGDKPESIYMVTSGTHYNGGCCFDVSLTSQSWPLCVSWFRFVIVVLLLQYGNSEIHSVSDSASGSSGNGGNGGKNLTDPCPGCGLMESIYWGKWITTQHLFYQANPNSTVPAGNPRSPVPASAKSANHPGVGTGPWVEADLESGVWAGKDYYVNPSNTAITADFVTAMLKGKSGGTFTLKGGDANKAGALKTVYDGARPPNYTPMKKLGAIVLGIGGDNSDFGIGTFYEGALTANYTSDATDAAVHANIVAAGYGK
eukprot:g1128.t1